MKHFLYKTTNKINQHFYIGIHSTKNADDGYLGSGKRLKLEIKKYGKENFEKVILEELPTRQSLKTREREIVNENLMKDPLCLNLKNGGEGGWDFVNLSGANNTGFDRDDAYREKMSIARLGIQPNISDDSRKKMSEQNAMKRPEVSDKVKQALTGRKKTDEHKKAIAEKIKQWHANRKAGLM